MIGAAQGRVRPRVHLAHGQGVRHPHRRPGRASLRGRAPAHRTSPGAVSLPKRADPGRGHEFRRQGIRSADIRSEHPHSGPGPYGCRHRSPAIRPSQCGPDHLSRPREESWSRARPQSWPESTGYFARLVYRETENIKPPDRIAGGGLGLGGWTEHPEGPEMDRPKRRADIVLLVALCVFLVATLTWASHGRSGVVRRGSRGTYRPPGAGEDHPVLRAGENHVGSQWRKGARSRKGDVLIEFDTTLVDADIAKHTSALSIKAVEDRPPGSAPGLARSQTLPAPSGSPSGDCGHQPEAV